MLQFSEKLSLLLNAFLSAAIDKNIMSLERILERRRSSQVKPMSCLFVCKIKAETAAMGLKPKLKSPIRKHSIGISTHQGHNS